jgi:gamma-D-glutamyl-L-lysine dipeptidyl-peptidase
MKEVQAAEPVVTLWTSTDSPRAIDEKIICANSCYEEWLEQLSYNERLALCTENLVQSQILFGETVLIIQEVGKWAEVLLPNQPTTKHKEGYPGWIPLCQLQELSPPNTNTVRISSTVAPLFTEKHQKWLTLSFGTELAVVEDEEYVIHVDTPLGTGIVKRTDIEEGPRERTGEALLKSARQFIGLPYLWGGMSGFGFDCSGFVYAIHRASGILIPRDASNQVLTGEIIDASRPAIGDLLYFGHDNGKGAIHHVAMYAGNGEMIHAPKTGKTVEQIPLAGTIYEKELCAVRRFLSAPSWRDI